MNTAFEIRIQVQSLLGTHPDGRIDKGGETEQAFQQLAEADPRAPWPPVSGRAFHGQFTVALRNEYTRLYSDAVIREEWQDRVTEMAKAIAVHEIRYAKLADALCARGNHFGPFPWQFIGIIHALEASLNFDTHLHNGDSLTARTKNEPKGRPVNGSPPFKWEESALDALMIKGLHTETDWSVARMLWNLERYNGFGYRRYHPEVLSPYLWSGTTLYRVGKYKADGVWDPELISQQIGAAALMKHFGF
jgi:lysozyme family protein